MSVLSARTEVCAAAPELLGGQLAEPALDEVQPGGGRGEVQDEPGVREQPALDRRGLVRRGVVEHQVHVEVGRDLAVDGLQELLELDRAVAGVQRADDLAGREVERGVEAGRAVTLVVVGRALGDPRAHRQDRRGPVQRLDLGLLIDAQHDGSLGRVEVQADDIADLVDEQRVLGELPRVLAVRLRARTPARSATPRSA